MKRKLLIIFALLLVLLLAAGVVFLALYGPSFGIYANHSDTRKDRKDLQQDHLCKVMR